MRQNYHHSEETRKKIAAAHKGKKLTSEHRLKVIKTLTSQRDQRGNKNPQWKGGVTKSTEGYIWIKKLDHPYKNAQGYVPEHRLVMEKFIGRYLLPIEHIHHLNENKEDNRIDNLRIVTAEEHAAIHWKTLEAKEKQSIFMKKVRKEKFWSTKKV